MSSFEKFCLIGFILCVSWMPYNLDRSVLDTRALLFVTFAFGFSFIITPPKK